MKYYTFTPPGTAATLVGINKNEISSSVNPYLASIGRKGIFTLGMTVSVVERIRINVGNPTQFDQLSALVAEGIEMVMNFDAFDRLVLLAGSSRFTDFLKEHRLGKLYTFNILPFGKPKETWLLPESVMQAIQKYNWGKHTEWMGRHMQRVEKTIADYQKSQKKEAFTFGFKDPK
jgi:hypothetical protein